MYLNRLIFSVCVLAFVGCQGTEERPYTDHTRDPQAFATIVVYTVDVTIAEARSSQEPADALFAIVEILEDLSQHPTGDHLSIYEELYSLASELQAECEAIDGRPADLTERLDQLEALAAQLPGERVAL